MPLHRAGFKGACVRHRIRGIQHGDLKVQRPVNGGLVQCNICKTIGKDEDNIDIGQKGRARSGNVTASKICIVFASRGNSPSTVIDRTMRL